MKSFIIEKGKHSAKGFHFGLTFSNKIFFTGSFDKSCLYKFNDVDDWDINKLFGFSTTFYHHKQSARVGWRIYDSNKFELLTYSYNKGVRCNNETDRLGIVNPNEKFFCEIIDTENEYVYKFKSESNNKEIIKFDPKSKDWFIFHYYLWPYFGGNKPAPHDMLIWLKY